MRGTLLQVLPVLFAVVLLCVFIRAGRIDREKIGLRRPSGPAAWLVLGYAVYLLILEVVTYQSGLLASEIKPWHLSPLAIVIRAIGIIVLTPFAEEVIFRGVLLSELRPRMRDGLAIVLQALVFTVFHALSLFDSHTPAFDVTQLVVEGAFYGWTRLKTRSLVPSMAMHAMGNALAVAERLFMG